MVPEQNDHLSILKKHQYYMLASIEMLITGYAHF